MTTVEREGFCLACGRDVGMVEVPVEPYRRPVDRVAVPSWCGDEVCAAARERFHALAERILYGED